MTKVIALAADTLLYAPLFIAREAGYFGNLQVVFGTFEGQSIAQGGNGQGPKRGDIWEMLRSIWDAFESKTPPLLTVCDPMHALVHNVRPDAPDPKPVLVGGLVRRPACALFDGAKQALLRRMNEGGLEITTHARGMTADTITRWFLQKKGNWRRRQLAASIKHTLPGHELDGFETANGRARGVARCAVSVDFLRMHALRRRRKNHSGITIDFVTDPDAEAIKDYFMTGMLALPDDGGRVDADVFVVLEGVNLALRLLRNRPVAAHQLLMQHFMHRYLRPAENELPHPSVFELELRPLEARLDVIKAEAEVGRFLGRQVAREVFPARVVDRNLGSALQLTWDVFRDAHSDIVARVCGVNARLDVPVDAGAALRVVGSKPFPNPGHTTELCLHFGHQMVSTLPHLRTQELVNWIEGLGGRLRISDYQVAGRFFCGDEGALAGLRDLTSQVEQRIRGFAKRNMSCSQAVFGPSGSGKDTLILGWIEQFVKDEIVERGFSIAVSEYDSAGAVQKALLGHLRRLPRESGRPSVAWVNEVNKLPSKPESIWSLFLRWLEDEGDGDVDPAVLRKIVWIFSGTLVGSAKEIEAHIRRQRPSGPDFVNRLNLRGGVAALRGPDPISQLLVFVGHACAIDDRSVVPREDRPLKIDADLLLWCAVQRWADAREPAGRVEPALRRMQNRRLQLADCLNRDEQQRFTLVYGRFLTKMRTRAVEIEWDLGSGE